MKHISLFVVIVSALMACNSKPANYPEIILPLDAPEIHLKISDLAENIRIVPLETNDSTLISSRFQIVAGEKYILVADDKEIHQFDLQGKHIRCLTRKGRAPEEYNAYKTVAIDNKNDLFYLAEYTTVLSVYNLQSGEFIEKIPTPQPIRKILKIKDDTLLCQANILRRDTTNYAVKYSLFMMTLEGKTLNGLPTQHKGFNFETAGCYYLPDGKLRFQSEEHQDSLFTINAFQKEIYATLKCTNNDDPDYTLFAFPIFENNRWHMIDVSPISMKTTSDGGLSGFSIKKSLHFVVDKKDYQGKLLKELYIDTLGISLPVNEISFADHFIFPVRAHTLKEIAKKQLQTGEMSPMLRELDQKIQEEDNPVLILGKSKL